MFSTFKWNVRGIDTQGVVETLRTLRKMHHLPIFAILEPFSDSMNIQNFKIQPSMKNAVVN